jgi:nucleoside-diphosphate-sugar epimerase
LEFEPDMEKVEILRGHSKPVDNHCAREEFGWVSHYSIEKTIEDFIKELKENPEMYE